MKYNLTYHNVKIGPFSDHQLKSAIQKYLRREMMEKGMLCLRLLLSVVQYISTEQRRVKTIISNTLNRLIVMMSEDIGISEPYLPFFVETMYRKYIEEQDIRYILSLYKTLMPLKKSRIISDIRAVFLLPFMDDKDLMDQDIQHHNDIIRSLFPHLVITHKEISLDDVRKEIFGKNLEMTFYNLGFLLRPHSDRKSNMNKIWKILVEMDLPLTIKQNISGLFFFYKKMTHREKTLYLYHAILLAIIQPTTSYVLQSIPIHDIKPGFDQLSDQIKTLELDNYVLDMHTGKSSSTPYDFVMSGAWIYKEDKTFYNPLYRLIYIRKKQILYHPKPCFYNMIITPNSKSDTMDYQSVFNNYFLSVIPNALPYFPIIPLSQEMMIRIQSLPHGQKKCGNRKKVVYVDHDYIYKGPYLIQEKSFHYSLFYQHALSVIEDKKTILPIEVMKNDNLYFLRSKNIGNPVKEQDIEIVSTKIETNEKIIKRGTFIFRASDMMPRLDTLQKKKCLQHLYHRFILNIGDSGLYNILVSKDGEIYGIDMEEQRNDCKFTHIINLLAPRVSKENLSLLMDALPWVDLIDIPELEKKLAKLDWPLSFKNNIIYRAGFIQCMLKIFLFYK